MLYLSAGVQPDEKEKAKTSGLPPKTGGPARATQTKTKTKGGHGAAYRFTADAPPSRPPHPSQTRRSRSALLITDTLLKLIAAAAIMGLSRMPKNGYSAPAATGTPRLL